MDSYVQREEPHEGPSDEPLELAKTLERSLEEPPAKRKPVWLKEEVREIERIANPKGTFTEGKMPHRISGYVSLVSNINVCEPSSFLTGYKYGRMPCLKNTSLY